MEQIFDEEMIRAELRRLDMKTGLHAADLPIKFGKARCTLGRFSYPSEDRMEFYFSNYYFQDPMHPIEEKLDTIRHEYAHYMDYMINGSSSHGPSWKNCCRIVGAIPTKAILDDSIEDLLVAVCGWTSESLLNIADFGTAYPKEENA